MVQIRNSNMADIKGLTICLLVCVSVVQPSGLPSELLEEIYAQQDAVNSIVDYVLNGNGRHAMYNQLADFSDDYGPRMSGTEFLEEVLDYCLEALDDDGFSNVHPENATVPHWIRGTAKLMMTQPRKLEMWTYALGTSIGTPAEGIEAEIIVVQSFDELNTRKDEVPGKIVVYNQPYEGYGPSVAYRNTGAARAAEHGAVAALVRSVTQYSVYSPHIGVQDYEDGIPKIPVASISVEDAEMLKRFQDRGKTVTMNLTMTCENKANVTSRNIIADWPGTEYPDEYVIIGGHVDSWDIGYGVMDDGGGVILTWQAMRVLETLGLKPKRTVRSIFWTGEEYGLYGAEQYFEEHKDEHERISIIMESDAGTFSPYGIGFTGAGYARAIMEEVMKLLTAVNATWVGPDGGQPDTGEWINIGVPGGSLYNAADDYFIYHHSHGDSVTMEDPDVLDRCTIVWASVSYVLANLEDKLPRSGDHPGASSAPAATASGSLIGALAITCALLLISHRRHT